MERCTGTLLTPERPRNSIHRRTRSLRRLASLLSTFPALAGVAPKTSRSIKPRERDLRDLRLFFLVRFFTRPTNHPRHAACASNHKSKPVRPHFWRINYNHGRVSLQTGQRRAGRERAIVSQCGMFRPRWNLSSRSRALSGGDMIVLSIPKSGRTWLRTFLCAYFCKCRGLPFTLEPEKYAAGGIPRIIYTHDLFEERMK